MIKLVLLLLLLLVQLYFQDAYSHGVLSGVSGAPVGGAPAIPQPDNEILRSLSGYQGLIFYGLIFGSSVLLYYAFENKREIDYR